MAVLLRIAPDEGSRGHNVMATCLVVLCLVVTMCAQASPAPVKPGKIYVGSFGMGDDAEQLKLALGYELARAGFKVVDFEQQADTTLTGLIVTRNEGGKSVKRVTVFLKDKAGKQLWTQDLGSTSTATRTPQDGIRQRAGEIAKALKKDSSPQKAAPTAKSASKN